MSEIVASFTPGVENYLGIISLLTWHILDENVGDHSRARRYGSRDSTSTCSKTSSAWLEDSVEVKRQARPRRARLHDADAQSLQVHCAPGYEIEGQSGEWRRQDYRCSIRHMHRSNTGVSQEHSATDTSRTTRQ